MEKSEYEQLRDNNIQRNEAFLKELGITDSQKFLPTDVAHRTDAKSKRQRRSDPEILPERRSSRISGSGIPDDLVSFNEPSEHSNEPKPRRSSEPVEIVMDDEGVERSPISPQLLRDAIESLNPAHSEGISDEAIRHCVMRINSMSNKRLATRAKMIARGHGREKMLAFYYGLLCTGLLDLADSVKVVLEGKMKVDMQTSDVSHTETKDKGLQDSEKNTEVESHQDVVEIVDDDD